MFQKASSCLLSNAVSNRKIILYYLFPTNSKVNYRISFSTMTYSLYTNLLKLLDDLLFDLRTSLLDFSM